MDSFAEIVQEVLTVDQSRELIRQLDEVIAQLYTSSEKAGDIYQNLPLPVKSALVSSLEKDQTNGDSAKVEEYLKKLIAYVESLPIIRLTLVYFPSEKNLKQIVQWLKANTGKSILVDIKVDPSVV